MGKKDTDKKTERLNIRLESSDKKVIARAAKRNGCSVSSFIMTSALTRATEILKKGTEVVFSEKQCRDLYASLVKPPKCPDMLKKAFDHYRRLEVMREGLASRSSNAGF